MSDDEDPVMSDDDPFSCVSIVRSESRCGKLEIQEKDPHQLCKLGKTMLRGSEDCRAAMMFTHAPPRSYVRTYDEGLNAPGGGSTDPERQSGHAVIHVLRPS